MHDPLCTANLPQVGDRIPIHHVHRRIAGNFPQGLTRRRDGAIFQGEKVKSARAARNGLIIFLEIVGAAKRLQRKLDLYAEALPHLPARTKTGKDVPGVSWNR